MMQLFASNPSRLRGRSLRSEDSYCPNVMTFGWAIAHSKEIAAS